MTWVKEYGPNGERAAFEIARTGAEGGIYTVLRAVAKQMLEEYSGNEITSKIIRFWEELSAGERQTATGEYLKKYGHLLPSELTEGDGVRVRANFLKVLQEHPHLIKRLRDIGRKRLQNRMKD